MSVITLYNTPSTISPAGNPLVFTSYSDDITEAGFKFLAEVYVGGTKVATLKKMPTEGNYQFFDVSKIVDNYVTYNFQPEILEVTTAPNSIIDYEVKGGYSTDAASGVTSYGTLYAMNASLDRKAFNAYAAVSGATIEMRPEGSFTGTTSTPGNFLTDHITRNVSISDYGTISAYNKQYDSQAGHFEINVWNSDGTFAGGYKMDNIYITATTANEFKVDIPIYPASINDAAAAGNVDVWDVSGWTTYTGAVITSSTGYYLLHGQYVSQILTPYYRFNVVDYCSPYDQIQMAWMNNWGAFDYLTFNMKSQTIDNFERKEYTKVLGALTNNSWGYNDTDFETTSFNISNTKEYIVNSNWLNDSESQRVIELLSSPIVYANIDGEWLPRVVTIESVLEQTQNNEKLIQYSLSLKSTYKNLSQRQ